MANYLMRYKGKYRVKAHIDQSTNDFPRDGKGVLDTDDLYIKCKNGSQIYHYGHAILVAYIPSLQRGHNILKALAERLCGINIKKKDIIDYDSLYDTLLKEGTIRKIKENDSEVEFYFHSKNIELIAEYLQPQTSGSGISPFSTRNLPKSTYVIDNEDMEAYRAVTASIPLNDILVISAATKRFMSSVIAKSREYRSKDIKAEMKKKMMKPKEFIHSIGYWDKYIEFLKGELSTYEKSR